MLKSSLKLPKGNELPILMKVDKIDKNKKILTLAIVTSPRPVRHQSTPARFQIWTEWKALFNWSI